MHRKITPLIMMLCITLVLAGCNGSKETDEVIYILGIGIDKGSGGMLKVTYQYAISSALAKEGSGDGQDKFGTTTFTTPSIAESLNLMGAFSSRIPNLSHMKMLVIGEEAAKSGIGDVLASFTRYREFRSTVSIVTVKDGTAAEILTNLKSVLELLPSKFVENMMLKAPDIGYIPPSLIHHFTTRLKGKSGASYTALVALNPVTGRNVPTGEKVEGEKAEEYTAGNLPTKGKTVPISFAGTALYRDDKMVGTLTTEETRMMLILTGELGRVFVTVSDPQVPDKPANVKISLREKPTITPSRENGVYKFDVSVHLEGVITSLPSGVHYEDPKIKVQLDDRISDVITQSIRKMLRKTQDLGSDVVGFGFHARHLYATYPQWQEAAERWSDDYRNADIRLTVKTTLRRSGLMWQTTPIKKTTPEEQEGAGQ